MLCTVDERGHGGRPANASERFRRRASHGRCGFEGREKTLDSPDGIRVPPHAHDVNRCMADGGVGVVERSADSLAGGRTGDAGERPHGFAAGVRP